MTWPFILNTVSPWPSVRKWLLILALNLPACQCEEGGSRGMRWGELGQLRPFALRPVPLINCPSPHPLPPPHSFSPGGACSLSLLIKAIGPPAPANVWWGKVRAVSMQTHVSLFLFAGTWWLEEERRVEWQPDGSHNKTVIERYVIVTISSWGKWYQRDIPVTKKREKKGDLF